MPDKGCYPAYYEREDVADQVAYRVEMQRTCSKILLDLESQQQPVRTVRRFLEIAAVQRAPASINGGTVRARQGARNCPTQE